MCASWVVVRVQRARLVGVALLASMTSSTKQAGLVELVVVAWTAEVHCVSSPVAVRALHLVVLRGCQSAQASRKLVDLRLVVVQTCSQHVT